MNDRIATASPAGVALAALVFAVAVLAARRRPEGLRRQLQGQHRERHRHRRRRRWSQTLPVAAGPARHDARRPTAARSTSAATASQQRQRDRHRRATASRAPIEVGKSPHGLAMMPDGRTLLVGVYGEDRVAFVDTATRRRGRAACRSPSRTRSRCGPTARSPTSRRRSPASSRWSSSTSPRARCRARVALDKPPRDPEFSADGSALYVTLAGVNAIQVLDPASEQASSRRFRPAPSPHIASVVRGRRRSAPSVVQGPGELQLFDPATNAPLRAIAVGKQPHWMASRRADGTRST